MMKYFVMLATVVALTQALDYGEQGIDVKINVEKNSNSYLSGRIAQGSFEYGLNVDKQKDNHFQHKVKGPDDVTYGCYGFVDPDGKPHLVHYVSDLKGYRIVPPESPAKIYISRLEGSINNVYQASQEKNVQWKDLFFPPACKQSLNDPGTDSTVELNTTPRPSSPTPSYERDTTTPTSTTTTTRRPRNPVISTPTPTTPSTTTPSYEPETTTRITTQRPTTPPPSIAGEPEGKSSNECSSVVNPPSGDREPQPACSKVCDELKGELADIKEQLKNLLDTLAKKPKSGAGGDGGKFAYFPVMLSDGLPDGVDTSSAKFAFPAVPQQCGNQ